MTVRLPSTTSWRVGADRRCGRRAAGRHRVAGRCGRATLAPAASTTRVTPDANPRHPSAPPGRPSTTSRRPGRSRRRPADPTFDVDLGSGVACRRCRDRGRTTCSPSSPTSPSPSRPSGRLPQRVPHRCASCARLDRQLHAPDRPCRTWRIAAPGRQRSTSPSSLHGARRRAPPTSSSTCSAGSPPATYTAATPAGADRRAWSRPILDTRDGAAARRRLGPASARPCRSGAPVLSTGEVPSCPTRERRRCGAERHRHQPAAGSTGTFVSVVPDASRPVGARHVERQPAPRPDEGRTW